jgi:hypothetical protein
LNCAGWVLSAVHQLTPVGYTVALLPALVATLLWLKKSPPAFSAKCFRRFRRPFPAIFLFATVLIFAGGLLYAPNNYDALTYRLPRMLDWLAVGRWHWIPTINERMNYSGTAWEWTALPWLALTRSDRALFLLNIGSFLWLPGLMFSVFRQLGVARRVAWTWMWILPLAYGYVCQAGSIGNDLFGATLGLLSVHFGLRARRSGLATDVWLALLAAAVMTGVKLSNLPLALPCLVAVWPALTRLRAHLPGTVAVAATAIVISALPIMALNQQHTGSWTGDPQDAGHMQVKSPTAALLGNSLLVAEQSFMPPVLPAAHKINDAINRHLPAGWQQLLNEKYPRFVQGRLNELPGEEGAGIGLGVALALLATLLASLVRIGRIGADIRRLVPLVALAAWISTLVFLLKLGSEAAPRLLLPYYALVIIPCLLLPIQDYWLRFRAWRLLLAVAALSVVPTLVLSVSRPLWPARSVSGHLARAHPNNAMLRRMADSYDTYARRNDLLAPVREHLPAGARDIGFIAGSNDSGYSLWRPLGWRRLICLRQENGQISVIPDQLEWLVIKEKAWPDTSSVPLNEWAANHQFQIVYSTNITELVTWGGENWLLLHHEQ